MWDLDAELVVTVEDLQDTLALWDQTITVNEDSVDIESESHVLSGLGLDMGHVLDLASENLAGWEGGLLAKLKTLDSIGNLDGRRESGATLHAWNWQGSAKGVAGASTLAGGWCLRQWVHDLVSVGIWRAGGWDLDGVAVAAFIGWDGQHSAELWAILDLIGLLSWCVRHDEGCIEW